MKLEGIQVLIWDFDGTFYRANPPLFQAVRESEYRTIMEMRHWTREQAVEEFSKLYKIVTPSATQTVAKICGLTTTEAADIMESYFDRREYLERDPKLVDMFAALGAFKHYILANGTNKNLAETLITLGVPPETFVEIVTSKQAGENKPSDRGFRYIMNKTHLPPASHLMIGDRDQVDLAPAKALGMKTCMVWGTSDIADVSLPTVYDVVSLFNER